MYTNIVLIIKAKYSSVMKKFDRRQNNIVEYRSLLEKGKINNGSLTIKNKENE